MMSKTHFDNTSAHVQFITAHNEVLQKENDELKQHNAELESMLVEVNNNRTGVSPCARFCEALAAKKMFDNLQRERDELAAQVEQLRKAGSALRKPWDLNDIIGAETRRLVLAWDEVYSTTPAQCLAEIKAQAVDALKFPTMLRKKWSGGEVQEWIKGEANQLRQQAKGGGPC